MPKLIKPLILLGVGFAAAWLVLIVLLIMFAAARTTSGSDIAIVPGGPQRIGVDEGRADIAREQVVMPPQVIPVPIQPEPSAASTWMMPVVMLGAVAIICLAAYHMFRLYLQYKRERDDVMFP
jgi:hypothetical protein